MSIEIVDVESTASKHKAIKLPTNTLVDIEIYNPESEPPYYSIYWPTKIQRREGVRLIFQSYSRLRGGYQIPPDYKPGTPLMINFKSKGDDVMEFSLDVEERFEPDEMVNELFNSSDFNQEFPWFRFRTPFGDYCLDGIPLHGNPNKIVGLISLWGLTAEIVSLLKTTTILSLTGEEMVQLGVHIRSVIASFLRLASSNT